VDCNRLISFLFPQQLHPLTINNKSERDRKPKGYWKNLPNCRKFFDDYAQEKGFDPLDAKNWYAVNLGALRKTKV